MQVSSNIYDTLNQTTFINNNNSQWKSSFLLLDISSNNNNNNNSNSTVYLDSCDAITFTMNLTNDFDKSQYPTESLEIYQDNGCWVLATTDNYVICACNHTTFFGLSWEEFIPDFDNYLNESYKLVFIDFGLVLLCACCNSYFLFTVLLFDLHGVSAYYNNNIIGQDNSY